MSGVPDLVRARTLLMETSARQPIELVAGHGVWVTDSEGRELIDLVAGIAVNVLGHSPPAVREALARQAAVLMHTSHLYYTRPQLEAAELLVERAFPGRVFFCNSGTEAVEGAIKLVRKWGRRHRGGATEILCAKGAFHGRTLGALAATGSDVYRAPFEPLPPGFRHVPYNDLDALAGAITEDTAAILLEPILGESGVHVLDDEVLRGARQLCDEHDLLLVLDEIQTGMGRTGRWWAHQHAGVVPDVMAVAKGLGGGYPVGAVIAGARADVFETSNHGSTFGGSPLASAVASAVLREIAERDLVAHAATVGEHLRNRLLGLRAADLPITEVRGRGLMLAAGLSEDIAPQVALAGLETGVLINPVGTRTLRCLPPLILTVDEADEAVERLRRAFALARGSSS